MRAIGASYFHSTAFAWQTSQEVALGHLLPRLQSILYAAHVDPLPHNMAPHKRLVKRRLILLCPRNDDETMHQCHIHGGKGTDMRALLSLVGYGLDFATLPLSPAPPSHAFFFRITFLIHALRVGTRSCLRRMDPCEWRCVPFVPPSSIRGW